MGNIQFQDMTPYFIPGRRAKKRNTKAGSFPFSLPPPPPPPLSFSLSVSSPSPSSKMTMNYYVTVSHSSPKQTQSGGMFFLSFFLCRAIRPLPQKKGNNSAIGGTAGSPAGHLVCSSSTRPAWAPMGRGGEERRATPAHQKWPCMR